MTTTVDKPFVWVTQDGEEMRPSEMKTTHLFYSLRMIWNHTAPPALQLPGGRYNGPQHWPIARRRAAVAALLDELTRRDDLPVSLDIQLGIMRQRAGLVLQKSLNQ